MCPSVHYIYDNWSNGRKTNVKKRFDRKMSILCSDMAGGGGYYFKLLLCKAHWDLEKNSLNFYYIESKVLCMLWYGSKNSEQSHGFMFIHLSHLYRNCIHDAIWRDHGIQSELFSSGLMCVPSYFYWQDFLSFNPNRHTVRKECVSDCYERKQRQCGSALQDDQ